MTLLMVRRTTRLKFQEEFTEAQIGKYLGTIQDMRRELIEQSRILYPMSEHKVTVHNVISAIDQNAEYFTGDREFFWAKGAITPSGPLDDRKPKAKPDKK